VIQLLSRRLEGVMAGQADFFDYEEHLAPLSGCVRLMRRSWP